MNEIGVNQVLAQIRAMSAAAAAKPAAAPAPAAAERSGFDSLLKSSIAKVNEAQAESTRLQQAFTLGDPNTDLATVMLAGAKAQVSFKAMVETRNRLVNAYQEIMNMPV